LTAALRSAPNIQDIAQSRETEDGSIRAEEELDTMISQFFEFGVSAPIVQNGDWPAELKRVSPSRDQIDASGSAIAEPALDLGVAPCEPANGIPCDEEVDPNHTENAFNDVLEHRAYAAGSMLKVKQISPGVQVGNAKPVSICQKQIAEIQQPVSAQGAGDVAQDETYCPWHWACPFIVKDLAENKPLIHIIQIMESQQAGSAVADANRPDRPANSDQVEQIRKLLLDELSDRVPGESPSDDLCRRIFGALAGCPLEWVTKGSKGIGLLRHRIRERQFRINSYGLAEHIARDVGNYWKENKIQVVRQTRAEYEETKSLLIVQVQESFQRLHSDWQALYQFANAFA